MITKAEVRALVLARLGPAPGRTIWDVGAGSGSVAVECARFGAWVIAIEADPAQCARIRNNAAHHGVQLRVLHGRAPEALVGLPPADAIFVGGGDAAVLTAAVRAASPSPRGRLPRWPPSTASPRPPTSSRTSATSPKASSSSPTASPPSPPAPSASPPRTPSSSSGRQSHDRGSLPPIFRRFVSTIPRPPARPEPRSQP